MPWTAQTSNESSHPRWFFSLIQNQETNPTPAPIRIAATGPTKPEAGVIATKPATAPVAVITALGFPDSRMLKNIIINAPAAAEVLVTRNALTAMPSAASELPALKPNHPNQRIPVPNST